MTSERPSTDKDRTKLVRHRGTAPPRRPSRNEFVVERVRRPRRSNPVGWLIGGVLLLSTVGLGFLLIDSGALTPQPEVMVANLSDDLPEGMLPDLSTVEPTPTLFVLPTVEPTEILPDAYVAQLSATPPPVINTPTPIPQDVVQPTFTPAFVPLTPALDLAISKIVFVCRQRVGAQQRGSDEICTINADGSNLTQLTANIGTDWYPSLSPDGTKIIYSTQKSGNFDIHIMDIDGRNDQRLTRNLGENYAPAISPDGTRVVFTSTFGTEGVTQNVWVMNIDGSDVTQLTDTPFDDIDPIWSPDGSQIAFASNRSGTTELHVMFADGSNVRQLTSGMNIGGRNDWSHDGLFMSFYAGPRAAKEIWLIDAECAYTFLGCIAEPRPLTDGGHNKGPSFSPDGQWVVYASQADEDQDNEVFMTRIDGSETRQLTFNIDADWHPRWSY